MSEFTINISSNRQSLSLCIPNLMKGISYKYEIYGDRNFYLTGSFEFNSNCMPCIKFKILDDRLFFVKLYRSYGENIELFHKFFDINKYNVSKNVNMSIEDKGKNELFESINLSESIETFNDAINSVISDINSTESTSDPENVSDVENTGSDVENEECPSYDGFETQNIHIELLQ